MEPSMGITRNERGSGLLMALLVLVALAAIGAGIMTAVSTDRRIASYNMTRSTALNYAEAGVAEALERIRNGDVPNNLDPKMVAQIFMTDVGNVPSVGADTTAMPTAQPAGSWLPYSSAAKGPDVLTIKYMTNSAGTGVYRYDATKTPPIQGVSGDPIFVVTSPARLGLSRRQIDAQVARILINPNLKAAYTSDSKIRMSDAILNGYDHKVATPTYTGDDGNRDAAWETGSNNTPGGWSTSTVSSGKLLGTPSKLENQSGFYAGPWEVIGMTQAGFFGWIGQPNKKIVNGALIPRGLTYLGDPKDKPGDGKKTYKLKGAGGDGLLYVNGNLEIDGDFTFRGLIYVEGEFTVKGSGWVLGGIVVKDKSKLGGSHHEALTALKSNEAVQEFIGNYGSPFITINWRES